MGRLGFWIFLPLFVAVDAYLFTQGYNSLFQKYKTDEEKEIQKLIIEKRRLEVEKLRNENK